MVDRVSFDGEVFAGGRETTKMDQWIAKPNDLLISKIRARQGSVGLISEECGEVSASIHYRSLIPKIERLNPKFAWLALRSEYCRAQFLATTGGAMKGEISEERLLNIQIPLPSLRLQEKIIKFRNNKLEKLLLMEQTINSIYQKSKISFLNELGIEVDNHSFGKKCFSLRWSGIDRWSLDFLKRDIAERISGKGTTKWPTRPLGELTDGRNGATPSKRNPSFWKGGIPWVSPKDMKSYCLNTASDMISKEALTQTSTPLILGPSIMMVMRSGILKHSVPVAYVERDMAINQDIRAFTVKEDSGLDPEFLAIFLQCSTQSLLHLVKSSVTVQSINTAELEEFPIPLPPLEVQRKLVTEMNEARAKIDAERIAANKLKLDTAREVEEMILGYSELK